MKKNIIILGGGITGKSIAIELNKKYNITVVDTDNKTLSILNRTYGIGFIKQDVTNKRELKSIISNSDLVISTVPGDIGFEVVKNTIEYGKNIVDISLMPENPFSLHERAKYKNVTAIVDCGLAPGMSNMFLGYHASTMTVESYECLVGGLPFERQWPWEYKTVFSPEDVISQYIRPARIVENGKQKVKQALSDPELIFFDKIGSLEAWNSDGLRTLLKTMPNIPNMIEKTLRYPGTIEYLNVLKESGFFSEKTIDINGSKVSPLEITKKLLKQKWELKKGDRDFIIMRIRIQGAEKKIPVGYEYLVYDEYNHRTGLNSMSRVTGYTCSAIAEMVLNGKINTPGINAPEQIASSGEIFHQTINYLKNKGITINKTQLY